MDDGMKLAENYHLWIDGRQAPAPRYAPVVTPFDGEPFTQAPVAGLPELEAAIAAAARRRKDAAGLTAFKRYEILSKASRGLAEQAELFARAIALESGKPISEARVEVGRAEQTLAFSAEEARRIEGEVLSLDAHPRGAGYFGFTLR